MHALSSVFIALLMHPSKLLLIQCIDILFFNLYNKNLLRLKAENFIIDFLYWGDI